MMRTRLWMYALYPFRWFRAWAGGYFWIPCPLCRQHFGGNEWRRRRGNPDSIATPYGPSSGRGICPACTTAGLGNHAGEPQPYTSSSVP